VEALAARGIVVTRHWDATLPKQAYIRASVHCYNTPEDINRLITALMEITGR
jgi:selenocysteine lyase/cysteine desulfurase